MKQISIIIPCRNEEKFISKCLDSIINNDFPKDKLEVLVIDGKSSDSTPEIVKSYLKKYSYITLLNNSEKNTIAGLNLGIKNTSGDIIMRVDGHSYIEKDYIQQCVDTLTRTGADNVGGAMRPVGETYIQQAIAFATSSIFGMGWGRFHYSDKEEYVDTVYLGAFKRSIFDKVGLFDPEMLYSEDNELNLRIIRNGSKILLSPRIKSYYYPRESLKELWKQYFNYGYFKLKVILKHGLTISLRHFIPSFFVASLFITAILSFFKQIFLYLLSALLSTYLIVSLLFSLKNSLNKGIRYFPILPIVFATLHFSYGIGFLKGIWDFIVLKKHKRRKIEDVPLTR